MEFPRLQKLNVNGLGYTEKLDYNPSDTDRIIALQQGIQERLARRDAILNTDYLTIFDFGNNMTQAMALGLEKRPCRQPYKNTSGVFFNITWLFKKVCLYLSKTVIYVKLRAVCNFKPASKQYLPHSTI